MPVEADLHVEWKVGADLDKEQPKLLIEDVEVVVRDPYFVPTVFKPDFRAIILTASSVTKRFLLRFADQYHTTRLDELRQMEARCIVFRLIASKINDG